MSGKRWSSCHGLNSSVVLSVLCVAPVGVLAAPSAGPVQALAERVAGHGPGICVVLGLPEGGVETVLRAAHGSQLIIYFQSDRAEAVAALRKAAVAERLLGRRIFADCGSLESIHLADNLADFIIVSDRARRIVQRAELLRVARPGGQIIIGSRVQTKPQPAGTDTWSHPYHGPDNNPVSSDRLIRWPYLTQFLAEPLFSPMPQVTVAAGGLVFRAFGHIAHKANQNRMLNTLIAVNGYNGAILWRRPLREGFLIHRNTMVATPQALYLGDDQSCKVLAARTGKLVNEIIVPEGIADGRVWKWMALQDGILYALVGGEEVRPRTVRSNVPGLGHWPWGMWEGHDYKDPRTNFAFGRTFIAIDPETNKLAWVHREQGYVDGRAVCMKAAEFIFTYRTSRSLACRPLRARSSGEAATRSCLMRSGRTDLLSIRAPASPPPVT